MIRIGLAAGFLKEPSHLTDSLLRSAASFLTFGGTEQARPGNPEPRTYAFPTMDRYVNAVNLENPGSTTMASYLPEVAARMQKAEKGLRINLTPTGSGSITRSLARLNLMPLRTWVELYEINVACPNHKDAGTLHDVLAHDPAAIRTVLDETVEFVGPFALKLAPDTDAETLRAIVDLCAEYRMKQITSGNTRRIETPIVDGRPVLHPSISHCGESGAPLVESNLRQVETLCTIIHKGGHQIRVSACGGILSGEVLRRYEDAGAKEGQIAAGYAMFKESIFSSVYQEYSEAA